MRFGTDEAGFAAMTDDVSRFVSRVWAIEGRNGIGRHVAVRLLALGEEVFDVPPKLLADRRKSLGKEHTHKVAQLHRLLLELIPGGAKKNLSAAATWRPTSTGKSSASPSSLKHPRRPPYSTPARVSPRRPPPLTASAFRVAWWLRAINGVSGYHTQVERSPSLRRNQRPPASQRVPGEGNTFPYARAARRTPVRCSLSEAWE